MRGPNRRNRAEPIRSSRASICSACQVCTCQWAYGKPVPGWTAEPSDLYKTGYRVLDCPQFIPMPNRVSDNQVGPEDACLMEFDDE